MGEGKQRRPNFLVLVMDQWDVRMELPEGVSFPALERLESRGIRFDNAYCAVPICSPSRAALWAGQHAKEVGVPDNTNFAWVDELDSEQGTIGTMLREQGYYTAFKGKWHCSEVPPGEDALERYGFSDYQQWGDMIGGPLEGEQLDAAVAFHTVDWLESRRPRDRPWLLVSSIINPHDIMYMATEELQAPHPEGAMAGLLARPQRMGWFEERWDVELPANFEDDLALQPLGVHSYRETIDRNYGTVPGGKDAGWLERRNYLINCMRLADRQFAKILDALDRLELWDDTVVILLSDHGEMNGAHRMHQKGAIHFEEAAAVYLTVCAPGGPQGERTTAVASLVDLAPTLLELAGVDAAELARRYPRLTGRSFKAVLEDAEAAGPRGNAARPGDGALYCWDGLNMLDWRWSLSGALRALSHMGGGARPARHIRERNLREAGAKYGAPDLTRRCFFRALVDGRYKLVRWFSPEEYGRPATVEELYATSDVSLHDLHADPGELENLGHPEHPRHDPQLVQELLDKLNRLIERELGEDPPAFDLDMFGTREVRYDRAAGSPR